MKGSLVSYAAWTLSKHSSTGQTLVLLSSVPISCTLTDIRSLAYKPPKPGSLSKSPLQSSRDSSSSSLAASITSIEFVRTMLLNPSGRVVVRFRDPTQAKEFAETARERVLGGNSIKAEIDRGPVTYHPTVKVLNAMQRLSPGRVVMLRGIPAHIDPARMEKILSLSYSLATNIGTTTDEEGREISLPAIYELRDATSQGQHHSTNFLVRTETVSSATMLVRRWHRRAWHTRDETRQHGHARLYRHSRNSFEEDTFEQRGQDEYGGRDGWSRQSRGQSEHHGQDEAPHEIPLKWIVDAYIMY